jgi:carbonic anhydrase
MPENMSAVVGRRQFLYSAATAALAGMAAWPGRRLAFARGLVGRTELTPDAAMQQLIAGNRRYVAEKPTSAEQDPAVLRKHTAEKQEPFAGVLACADSRMPVELVFDQSIGQIFVARVAGNIVTPEITASLEYAVAVLGIRALLVLGHSHCGAVKAAMTMESVPGQISALYSHIKPAVDQSGGDVEKAVAANARLQAELLRSSSTVIRKAIASGTLKVAAGVYDLATGRVAVL